MMMMRMMVELVVFWILAEVKEVSMNLLEKVELPDSQMERSVIPIWLIGWLLLPMLILPLPLIWLEAC
jgi:hypothetical protein